MTEPSRLAGLSKLPQKPALSILAAGDVRLETPVAGNAKATPADLLADLDAQRGQFGTAEIDMLKVLCQTLPPREAVWWACLSARDLVGDGKHTADLCVASAEAWVFRPGDETRRNAFVAMQAAKPSDPTSLAAMAAVYAEGTMGPDEMEAAAVQPGMFGNVVLGMVLSGLDAAPDGAEMEWMNMLIARGLDIAAGSSGRDVPVPVDAAPAAEF